MALIRSKNTEPERKVFSHLRSRGIYFQRHYGKVPGSPDVALPRQKKAVFIDGDFWHGYQFHKRRAKLSPGYWLEKIEANIARDRRTRRQLRKLGWKVLRVWEHELRGKKGIIALEKIENFLLEDTSKLNSRLLYYKA